MYQFLLFAPGEDLVESAVATWERLQDDWRRGIRTPKRRSYKQRLANVLREENQEIEWVAFDFGQLASMLGVDEAAARRIWRHLELGWILEGAEFATIRLFDDYATVDIPSARAARLNPERLLTDVWRSLGVLEREAQWRTYDPQLEGVLDLPDDFDAVLACYAGEIGRGLG